MGETSHLVSQARLFKDLLALGDLRTDRGHIEAHRDETKVGDGVLLRHEGDGYVWG